jgi:hypothetical protein
MVVSPYSEFDFFPAVGGVYCDSGMVKLLFLRSISDDGGFSGWSVVPAREGGDLFLGWFFIGVQVSLSACGELFCFWPSAAAPMTVDLVLASFGEEDADWHSTFQMQLNGVFGLLVLAAAFMCSSSSSNPTREFTGQRHRCHRPGVVKTDVSSRRV